MCGIFFTNNEDNNLINKFDKLKHRGPDGSIILRKNNFLYGFHRLSIINPKIGINQPFQYNNIIVLANAEIYNWKYLAKLFNISIQSDCELIIHLYIKFNRNFKKLIQILDAEFAIILHDLDYNTIYVARDFMGIRPLYYSYNNNKLKIGSELRAFDENAEHILPRNIYKFNLSKKYFETETYWEFPNRISSFKIVLDNIYGTLYDLFIKSVVNRINADRPIGCLLSGGLDSSLIASLVSKFNPNVKCFVIGADDSPDVIAAKKVADFLNLSLEIVPFNPIDALETIPDVINSLETYDITTVRASTPQWHLAKWISENTDIKVVFSGEGSDELFNGYSYTKLYNNATELRTESQRLLSELYLFDCLRTDRTMSAFSLEVRVPFLYNRLIEYVSRLDPELLIYSSHSYNGLDRTIEKALLRNMVDKYNLLPKEIIWRSKEAFSDAVGFSWKDTITEYTSNYKIQTRKHLTPISQEAEWYRQLFEKKFPNQEFILPHYWLPKKYKTNDPSARVLPTYK
jgi:asparagine synthase (glutamine-hydrolysing)